MIKIIYIYILILFFNCASQGMPQGGPVDIDGPVFLGVYPNNKKDIKGYDTIVLEFDERINPNSILNSISINPIMDVSIKTKNNNIIIKPLEKWDSINPIEINLNRNISDFRSNKIDQGIQLIYNIKNYKYASISGKLFNALNKIYNIYIYEWPLNNIDSPVKKINSDVNNNFKIDYLNPGKYIVFASEGNPSIYQNRYGVQSESYIELSNDSLVEDIYIYIDEPLEKLRINRVEALNTNLVNIFYSNNSVKPYILDSVINDNDTIYINITEKNRLETYKIEPYLYLRKNILDTIPPSIVSVDDSDTSPIINFSEPINQDSLFIMGVHYNDIDAENWKFIDYDSINPMTVNLSDSNLIKIKFLNVHVQDLSQNKMIDSVKVYNLSSKKDIFEIGSSLKGKLISSLKSDVVVEARNVSFNASYYDVVEDSLFAFEGLLPGKYVLRAYESKNRINPLIYFSGTLDPYQSAAQFSIYKDTIEVRKFWDAEGVNIEF